MHTNKGMSISFQINLGITYAYIHVTNIQQRDPSVHHKPLENVTKFKCIGKYIKSSKGLDLSHFNCDSIYLTTEMQICKPHKINIEMFIKRKKTISKNIMK